MGSIVLVVIPCPDCRGKGFIEVMGENMSIAHDKCAVCNGLARVRIDEDHLREYTPKELLEKR